MTVVNDTRKKWLALFVLCGGSLMIVLDSTIVNVALSAGDGRGDAALGRGRVRDQRSDDAGGRQRTADAPRSG